MNKVVVYTPVEDFFYNTALGSTIVGWFFVVLISIAFGLICNSILGGSITHPNRRTSNKTIIGDISSVVLVVLSVITFYKLLF